MHPARYGLLTRESAIDVKKNVPIKLKNAKNVKNVTKIKKTFVNVIKKRYLFFV